MTPGRARFACSLGALALLGCRQIFGVDDYHVHAVADAGAAYKASADGVEYASRACAECIDGPCSSQASACAGEPACLAMSQCLAKCTVENHDCRGACNLKIPRTDEFTALTACEAMNGCSSCAGSRTIAGNAACDTCVATKCAEAQLDFSKRPGPSEPNGELCGASDCPLTRLSCACAGSADAGANSGGLSTCTTGGDACKAACGSTVADWSCLGSVIAPPPAEPKKGLSLHVAFLDGVNLSTPVKNFTVAACTGLDPICSTGTLKVASTTDGWATLKLDPAPPAASTPSLALDTLFFGNLFVTSDDLGYPGALVYFFPPVRTNEAWVTRHLVTRAVAETAAGTLGGLTIDWSGSGGIAWSSESCSGPAPGIHVELDSGETMHYIGDNGLPDGNRTATSSFGTGFALNLSPRGKTLTATVAATGELIGKYSVQVVKGSITHLVVTPQAQ